MNLCQPITAHNAGCGSITGGIKSIELIDIHDYLQKLPDRAGDAVTYYYRRGTTFFFRNREKEIFKIITSPIVRDALLPQLTRGQQFIIGLK